MLTNKKESKTQLTAVIIVKNEEKMLPECLKSLSWVSHILVIDTGSTDKTTQIARKAGAKVVSYEKGKSFSDWRNKGLKDATTEWILYVDADERIPDLLKKEITTVISQTESLNAYAIPRSNIIFGKEFRHGGFWPDYVKRLFKKSQLHRWTGELHEEPVFEGNLGHLDNYILHDKHETLAEMVEKTNNWSLVEAKLMFAAHHPPMNIIRFSTGMFREFWYRMIVKLAFRDGTKGIIMAIYQVFSRFCSYAKLWELQIAQKKHE